MTEITEKDIAEHEEEIKFEDEVSFPDIDKVIELKDDEVDIDTMSATPIMAEEEDDSPTIPALMSCSIEEADATLTYLKGVLPVKVYETQLLDPKSHITALRKIIANSTASDQLNRDKLTPVVDNLATEYIEGDLKLADASPVSRANFNGKIVSGKEATMLLLAKERNVRRIYLYNSGFDITLKGPSLDELNIYYNKTSSEVQEYGREYGAHFYMFSDLIIKKASIELFMKLVTNASVKNWRKGQTLAKAIKISDYDTILWAIGSLMFKAGFPFQFACTNPDHTCSYTEELKIDLKKIRYNNYSIIPKECLTFLGENKVRTLDELAHYNEMLGLSKTVKLHGAWSGITKVPSIHDFLTYGALFNASLLENVQIEDRSSIHRYLQFNYYKILAPWMSEVRYHNEDGSLNFRIQDMASIIEVLDTSQLEDTTFGKEMEEFIKSSCISHICIPFTKCPACGHVPSYSIGGYLPFDVQQNFFIQSVMRLAQSF